jgi:hypothetical protein
MKPVVVKRHKRLWIIDLETGAGLYTPPNFIRLANRDPLHVLAYAFALRNERHLDSIMDFESEWSVRR